jgi:cytochrome c5
LDKIPAFHGVLSAVLFHRSVQRQAESVFWRAGAIRVLHNKKVPGLLVTHRTLIVGALFLTGSLVCAAPKSSKLPDGPGKATVERICSGCHAPEIILGRHETADGWAEVVSDMVSKGANGTDDEFNTIIDYLAKNFPAKTDSQSKSKSSGVKD